MQLVAELANPSPADRQLPDSTQERSGPPAQPVVAEMVTANDKDIPMQVYTCPHAASV